MAKSRKRAAEDTQASTSSTNFDDTRFDPTVAPNGDNGFGTALKTLDIQGFRSFGPLAADVGHIDFISPVTLILGPNGTGKTTIIECLKFATTGEVPPNSSKGAAFIHDPKISHDNVIRGQISLKFWGADNVEYVLTRTAEGKTASTRGAGDVKFKSLETTLNSYVNGKKQSVVYTVDQAGQTMQTVLGVSKAILNSVIFCHQEESNWPLDQAAKLKDKFDEIFSATKYIKALEEFRELKKNDKKDLEAAKQQREDKRVFRNEAESKRVDLAGTRKLKDTLDHSLDEKQTKLADLETLHNTMQYRVNKISKLESELEALIGKISAMETLIHDLEHRLGDEFVGSTDQMDREMRNSGSVEQDKRAELHREKKKAADLEKKLNELRKNVGDDTQKLGELNAQSKEQTRVRTERNEKIRELSNDFGLKMYMGTVNYLPGELEAFMADFSTLQSEEKKKSDQLKKEREEEMSDLAQRIMGKNQERQNLEKEITKLKKETKEYKKKEEDINDQLQDMQSQSKKLSELDTKIQTQDGLLKERGRELDVLDLKQQISENQQKRKQLLDQIKPLKSVIVEKEAQQCLISQIDMLKGSQNEKKDLIDKLLNKLQRFLDATDSQLRNEDIKSYLISQLNESAQACDDSKKEIGKLETEIALKENDRTLIKKEVDSKEAEIKDIDEKMDALAEHGDITCSLKHVEDEVSKLQNELADWKGKSSVLKGYKESIQRQDTKPCCPTCHRRFADESEAQEVIDELDSTMRDVPKQVATREKKITESSKKRDKIVTFMPECKKLTKLKEEVTTLEKRQKKLNDDLSSMNKKKTVLEGSLVKENALYQICTASQSDCLKLDAAITDLKKLEKDLKALAAQMPKSSDSRSLEELKAEKETSETEIERFGAASDTLSETVLTHEARVSKIKDELNRLREEKIKIGEKLQQRLNLEHQLKELQSAVTRSEQEVIDQGQKFAPLKQAIDALTLHKNETQARQKQDAQDQTTKLDTLNDGLKELKRLAAKIKEFEKSGVADKLQSIQSDVDSATQEIKKRDLERVARTEDIRKLEKELDNLKNRDQILKDNKTLRMKRDELKELQRAQEVAEEKLRNEIPEALRKKLTETADEKNQCSVELHTDKGRRSELEKSIIAKEKELDAKHYKDAQTVFNTAVIKCHVLDVAMRDVEKFYKALDFAVMKFHSTKMEEINKILRDLWQSTYQGNDIDYIEIRSNADETGIEGEKGRRTYNYRVVMISEDTAIDMRGRCSAGQRVLACLIIRLALAEAFALHCGILALDEPTTNLDRDNIEHLAKSLGNLIRGRQYAQQRNRFQLIIITHDSDFLNTLNINTTGPLVDRYYKIYKDTSGKSRLKNLPYSGHF